MEVLNLYVKNELGGLREPAYLTDFPWRMSRTVLKAAQYKVTSSSQESSSIRVKSALGKFKLPSSPLLTASAVNWKPNTRVLEQPQLNAHVWVGKATQKRY